jgi:hypothetical protein
VGFVGVMETVLSSGVRFEGVWCRGNGGFAVLAKAVGRISFQRPESAALEHTYWGNSPPRGWWTVPYVCFAFCLCETFCHILLFLSCTFTGHIHALSLSHGGDTQSTVLLIT